MKNRASNILVLLLLITFLSISAANPIAAQTPPPIEESPIQDRTPIPGSEFEILPDRNLMELEGDNTINATIAWVSVGATVFNPYNSATGFFYYYDGCLDPTTSGAWRGQVSIPDGSTINSMWFNYFNDVTDPVDSTLTLQRISYTGVVSEVLSVNGTATGTSYHFSADSTPLNNIVTNGSHFYSLYWSGGINQELCSVNISYTPPSIFGMALPVISK